MILEDNLMQMLLNSGRLDLARFFWFAMETRAETRHGARFLWNSHREMTQDSSLNPIIYGLPIKK